MPQVSWAMICDYVLADLAGKYSLIGVFDRINASVFPHVHPALFYTCLLNGPPNRACHVTIRLWSPVGAVVHETLTFVAFSPVGGAFIAQQMAGLSFDVPGEYIFECLCDGVGIHKQKLDVLSGAVA